MPVAKIDNKLCNGCGKCVDTCPEDVFRLNLKPIDKELCSPCAKGCPAGINVRLYSYYVEMDMMDEAIAELRAYNPFPAVTGRVCPHECENSCARREVDESVNIHSLERYVGDYFAGQAAEPVRKIYAAKVAVVGSGPAGLSCAYYLCKKGYGVTVFEKQSAPGGMLSAAIPDFRLPRDVVSDQIRMLTEMGVSFRCGVEIGRDLTVAQLKEQGYESIFLAIGLQGGGKLGIPGESAEGVLSGVDYVKGIYLGKPMQLSGRVVVIGGGKIGADVARLAIRGGAESVSLYCLESYDTMPMGVEDRSECEKDGVSIHAGWGQTEIVEKDGRCAGIRFRKCLRVTDANGNFAPEFDDSVAENAECTTVLYCIGQKADWGELLNGTAVALSPRGLAIADPMTCQTAEEAIFVGGDAFTGQKHCVDAIAAGRRAAESIDRYLRGADLKEGRNDTVRVQYPPKDGITTFPRQNPQEGCGFTENEARLEAQRCMTCGSRSEIVYPDDCMVCLYCQRDCPNHAITITPDRIAHHIEPWDLG